MSHCLMGLNTLILESWQSLPICITICRETNRKIATYRWEKKTTQDGLFNENQLLSKINIHPFWVYPSTPRWIKGINQESRALCLNLISLSSSDDVFLPVSLKCIRRNGVTVYLEPHLSLLTPMLTIRLWRHPLTPLYQHYLQ